MRAVFFMSFGTGLIIYSEKIILCVHADNRPGRSYANNLSGYYALTGTSNIENITTSMADLLKRIVTQYHSKLNKDMGWRGGWPKFYLSQNVNSSFEKSLLASEFGSLPSWSKPGHLISIGWHFTANVVKAGSLIGLLIRFIYAQ
jgi:hypothetical protein